MQLYKSGKKIVLYQGSFHKDRNLEPFFKAIDKLQAEYVLVIMGRKNKKIDELLYNHPGTIHIPWINAPKHLEITSWAHIGILTYIPSIIGHLSILNSVYCAPNKIFEYTGFGIPMIANDCPPLKNIFEKNNIGVIVDIDSEDDIIRGILEIEKNYMNMKDNCTNYFSSINLTTIINGLFESL